MIISAAEIMKRVSASERRDSEYSRGSEPVCGTSRGFARHRRRSEAICQPCREAENARKRELRARKASKS